MLISSLGVLLGFSAEDFVALASGSKKFSDFLELDLGGKTVAGVGVRRLLVPSISLPESTRATVFSSLATGEGIGESRTPTLPFAAPSDRANESFDGG